MRNVMDAMALTECDDDIRTLTQEMPDGVLAAAADERREITPRPSRGKRPAGCLRAFTVHPGWAWAILKGVKTQEWRTFLPNPRKGTCAITVSKSYSPGQWRREAECVREEFGADLIPYEELTAAWCGRVVAVCDYAADEDDLDDNGFEYGWRLSNVRPLRHRLPCKGALKLWTMDAALSAKVLDEVV